MVEWSVPSGGAEKESDLPQEEEPPTCSTKPPSRVSPGRRYRWSFTTASPAPWAHQLRADSPPHRYFAQRIFIGSPSRSSFLRLSEPSAVMEVCDHEELQVSDDPPGPSTYIPGLPPVPPNGAVCFPLSSAENNIIPAVEAYIYSDPQQAPAMLTMLAAFRSQKNMCDVEIEVEGSIIAAHKCVLAASVPYFRSMFNSLMLEATQSKIKIQDITAESLELLIDFVYTSTIRIDSDNIQNLLFAASILQMDNVCLACQKFLSRFLTTANCLSIRQFAEQYNCIDLLENTDDFAVDNFSEIRKLEDFFAIPFKHLRDLIKRLDLNVENEEEVFESVVAWIGGDELERMKYLPELLTYVQLPQLSTRFLLEKARSHPYIRMNRQCNDIVCDALIQLLKNSQSQAVPVDLSRKEEGCYQYSAGQCAPSPSPAEPQFSVRKSRPRKSTAGVIFCAGGRGTLGDPFRSVEAYDWRKNRWLAVPEMTQQRRHVGVVSVKGKLYAIGGHDGQSHLASAEVFDPSAGAWRRIAPMNTSRRGIAVAAIGEAIFAVGGLDDQTCFQTVERYDIELDTWTEAAKMQIQRGGVGVTALDNYLYAVGGNDGSSSLDSCERYDPLLNRWKMIKPMNYRRAGAGVCVMDGYLYALGGFDDNSPLSTCERYNPATDTWECLPTMGSPRGGVGIACMGGAIYAIGGHDGTRYLNTVECLEPSTGGWEPVAEIKECRAGAGVAWADCSIMQLLRPLQESGCAPSGGSQCI